MSYIKITNQASLVNRLSLEKLGLSTKRDDPGTIGQFGSGIKYAPIAALRMGLEWVFTGNDNEGGYTLKYQIVDEFGINSIYYDYGNEMMKPSSFTLEAGMMSWEDEFQVYREAISNAKDGGDWSREIVDTIGSPVENEFSVYITASPAMLALYNDHDSYFCDNQIVVSTFNDIKILKPIDGTLKVYCKSVLVHESDDIRNNIYNYEVNSASLNEDRELKSLTTTAYDIVKAIAKISDESIIDQILETALSRNQTTWEFDGHYGSIYSYTSPTPEWKKVFHKKFGDNAVVLSPEESVIPGIETHVKTRGKKPVRCTSKGLYTFLTEIGTPLAAKLISEEFIHEVDERIENYPKLSAALRIAETYEPGLLKMNKPVAVFKTKADDILGMVINSEKDISEKQIVVDQSHATNSNIYELVATLIHEYDHYSTGITDNMYRQFRNLADNRIGRLVVDAYQKNLIDINENGFWIKVEDLGEFGGLNYNIYETEIGGLIMTIGRKKFFVTNDDENVSALSSKMSGILEPSKDGKSMGIGFSIDDPHMLLVNRL